MPSTIDQLNPDIESIKKNLFKLAKKGEWCSVVEIYRTNLTAHKVKLTRSGDTALHIAVPDSRDDIDQELVKCISAQTKGKEVLEIENGKGNTPLHIAASMIQWGMWLCESA